jgi:hypothetical protein
MARRWVRQLYNAAGDVQTHRAAFFHQPFYFFTATVEIAV